MVRISLLLVTLATALIPFCSVAQDAPEEVRFSVDEPRPLWRLAYELGQRYGIAVSYEDHPYGFEATIPREGGTGSDWRMPAPARLAITSTVMDSVRLTVGDAETVLRKALAAYHAAEGPGYYGRFRLVVRDSMFHIIPVSSQSGLASSARPARPVLDTPVTLRGGSSSAREALEEIVAGLNARQSFEVRALTLPIVLLGRTEVELPGGTMSAREALLAIVRQLPIPHVWALKYDFNGGFYALNLQGVRSRDADRRSAPPEFFEPPDSSRMGVTQPPAPRASATVCEVVARLGSNFVAPGGVTSVWASIQSFGGRCVYGYVLSTPNAFTGDVRVEPATTGSLVLDDGEGQWVRFYFYPTLAIDARDDIDLLLEVSGAASAAAEADLGLIPDGEINFSPSWGTCTGFPDETISEFTPRVTPTSADFDGRRVREDQPYAGSDRCYQPGQSGNPNDDLTGLDHFLTGNEYTDCVGLTEPLVEYYQQYFPDELPCTIRIPQEMQMRTSYGGSAYWYPFVDHDLTFTVTELGVEACRGSTCGFNYFSRGLNKTTSVDFDPAGVREAATTTSAAVYPNPMASRGVLEFALEEGEHVHARLFNALGEEVALLKDGYMPRGRHELPLILDLPSGLYAYRIELETLQLSGTFVVAR